MKKFLPVLTLLAVLFTAFHVAPVEATSGPFIKEVDDRFIVNEGDIDDLEYGISACGSSTETTSTDDGAISVSTCETLISSAAAEGRTLAAPAASAYRMKIIRMSVDNGDVTVAATNILDQTGTCTFNDAGDTLVLFANGNQKWVTFAAAGVSCS